MNQPGTAFLAIAACFLLVILSLCLFGVRRFQLRRALGTVDASICLANRRWRMGVCRYQESELEWFRLLSLSPRPRVRMQRSAIVLVGRRKPTEEERTQVQPDTVIVTLEFQGREILMAMKFDAYAGLSSWLEAGPVIGVGTWR
ncbi:DUF2550 domain-containing protein [Specibacter cremeus]|uniref:DUF2550 domain-containing protein n=1 Tax=Specibacter cremeus TaxID=1629051 RepID=UPI000F77DF33|nr:DUF2550 domain-containing protein [Specibacter cremeus]